MADVEPAQILQLEHLAYRIRILRVGTEPVDRLGRQRNDRTVAQCSYNFV